MHDLDEFPEIRDNPELCKKVEEIAMAMFYTWSGGIRVNGLSTYSPEEKVDKAIIRQLEIYIWG